MTDEEVLKHAQEIQEKQKKKENAQAFEKELTELLKSTMCN